MPKLFLLFALGLCQAQPWAQTPAPGEPAPTPSPYHLFPVLECPAVGDEYEKMIAKLESIQAAIRKDANCDNVALKVKSLEELIVKDREEVLAITRGQQEDATLTAEEARKVHEYAENVTRKVASLNDLFLNSNHCFREDDADTQLAALAGFVSEASQLVSSLSGPWGTPISLGGHVVAGFLTGMDEVLKSRAGYDYKKRQQWSQYVQNLCTYHGFRGHIDHLLNPEAHISKLESLRRKIDSQMDIMLQKCPECRDIQSKYEARKSAGEHAVMIAIASDLAAANVRFSQPFGTYTAQSLGLRDWVLKEIDRVQREARSYWTDVSGRHVLINAKEEIEGFLIDREAPRFLSHQISQARDDFSGFISFAGREGRPLYSSFSRMNPDVITVKLENLGWTENLSLALFRALVLNPINWNALPDSETVEDLKYTWTYYRDESLNLLRGAQTTTQVAQNFCSFFKHSGHYTSSIRSQCRSPAFANLKETLARLEGEMGAALNSEIAAQASILNPLVRDNVDYARDKLEALSRTLEFREVGGN